MEGKQEKLKAYGGIAFICVKLEDNVPTRLYFGRNHGRPLNLFRTKQLMMLSSEGEGDEIKATTLYTYNYQLDRLTTKFFLIPAYKPYEGTWSNTQSSFGFGRSTTPSCSTYGPSTYWDDEEERWKSIDDDDDWWDDWMSERYGIPSKVSTTPESLSPFLPAHSNVDEQAINKKYFDLLGEADGSYLEAYWIGIRRHDELQEKTEYTSEDFDEMETLFAACEMLDNDPGYRNYKSIHPLWQTGEELDEDELEIEEAEVLTQDEELKEALLAVTAAFAGKE